MNHDAINRARCRHGVEIRRCPHHHPPTRRKLRGPALVATEAPDGAPLPWPDLAAVSNFHDDAIWYELGGRAAVHLRMAEPNPLPRHLPTRAYPRGKLTKHGATIRAQAHRELAVRRNAGTLSADEWRNQRNTMTDDQARQLARAWLARFDKGKEE